MDNKGLPASIAYNALLLCSPEERGQVICWFCSRCFAYEAPGQVCRCKQSERTCTPTPPHAAPAVGGAGVVVTDGRQLDAFAGTSRVGSLLEVARDEMLDRAARGEPVAWVASGNAGTVLHGWLAVLIKRNRDGHPQTWRVTRIGAGDKAHGWSTARVTKEVAQAEAMLDPDSPRCLRERSHGPIFDSARVPSTRWP